MTASMAGGTTSWGEADFEPSFGDGSSIGVCSASINLSQRNALYVVESCKGRSRNDDLCALIFFSGQKIDERLHDKILLVLDHFTEKFSREIDDG